MKEGCGCWKKITGIDDGRLLLLEESERSLVALIAENGVTPRSEFLHGQR